MTDIAVLTGDLYQRGQDMRDGTQVANEISRKVTELEANADKNAAALAVQIRKTVKAQEALQTVIDACDADCSLTHIAWLAKQGLRP